MILCIVGYSGSGKTTIGNALLESYRKHFKRLVDVSDIVRKYSEDQTGKDVIKDQRILNHLDFLLQDDTGTVVVGCRELYIIQHLQRMYNAKVVHLTAKEQKRFDRLKARGLTTDAILKKDLIERQIGLSELIHKGEDIITINNDEQCVADTVVEICLKTIRRPKE